MESLANLIFVLGTGIAIFVLGYASIVAAVLEVM